MFDISWTEFLLIGVVALIVIGPKELPGVLRTMGQYTRKVRSMAADFQAQFQEAMREAEMADLKKQVDDIAQDVKNYDPLKDVRADIEAAGKDIHASLQQEPVVTPTADAVPQDAAMLPAGEAPAEPGEADVAALATGPITPEALPKPEAEAVAEAVSEAVPEAQPVPADVVAAATGPVVPEAAGAGPESPGRAG